MGDPFMTQGSLGPKDTQSRLLAAAGAVFASKGYRQATVAEICRKAKANVAAVNYHFGSKKDLYVESWRHEFHNSLAKHPVDGGIPPEASVEERLHGRIAALLHRTLDPDSLDFDILHKEMVSPTGFLSDVKRSCIEPIRKGLTALVAELMGSGADERQVRLCQMSIISQCLGPMMRERRRKLGAPGSASLPYIDVDLETLATHITRFSLAGVRELAEKTKKRRKTRHR